MEVSGSIDIFATKGIEYLFVLFFLFSLIFFWRCLNRLTTADRTTMDRPANSQGSRDGKDICESFIQRSCGNLDEKIS
jgi:hypothetical protein